LAERLLFILFGKFIYLISQAAQLAMVTHLEATTMMIKIGCLDDAYRG
jgi:hypothetical protein